MNFGIKSSELKLLIKGQEAIDSHWAAAMQGRMAGGKMEDYKWAQPNHGNNRRAVGSNYFSLQSFLVLVCLTASLLILPLVLPPLPPPPSMILLLPVCIFVLLLILALMPSDVRDISMLGTSS